MNSHVHRFYRKFADEQAPIRIYHEVICLHETPHLSWEDISKRASSLPKGWYELSQLKLTDRLDFCRDFWLETLPFIPHVHSFLQNFFSKLDDLGVFLTQDKVDSPFECEMVYSLKDDSCFYHGSPPCTEQEIQSLKRGFASLLPDDYLAFLKIHDGFSKHVDTGMIKTKYLQETKRHLIQEWEQPLHEISFKGKVIDPNDLIPFYESFGQSSYQCFFSRWTPYEQTGNVYYSLVEKTISDMSDPKQRWQDHLAFPTFLDWLIFYLESIE